MPTRFSMTSTREAVSLFRVILPLSILDISRISLISPTSSRPESSIFLKQSLTFSGSSICVEAILVIPMIAFMGVRIS